MNSQTETEPFQAMLCNSKIRIEVGELVFSASHLIPYTKQLLRAK